MGLFQDFFTRPLAKKPEPSVGSPERRQTRRPRIARGVNVLVVDDSKTVVFSLARMLESNGFRVHYAYDGESAVKLAQEVPLRLVFLDIVLPGMSGFQVLRAMRKSEATGDVPIIMMSGNAAATEEFYAKRIGADDFMRKPFTRLEVFARIHRMVNDAGTPQRIPL
jgi:DNA-binding response OmpR family regulator